MKRDFGGTQMMRRCVRNKFKSDFFGCWRKRHLSMPLASFKLAAYSCEARTEIGK